MKVYVTYIFMEFRSCQRKATILFDMIMGLVDIGNCIDTIVDIFKASCMTIWLKHLNYAIYGDHARWIKNQLTDVSQNAIVTEEVSKSTHRADSGEVLHTPVHCHKMCYNPYTDIIFSRIHHIIMKINKWCRYWHYKEHIEMLNCTLRSLFLKDELIFWIEAGMTSCLQEGFFNK